MFVGGLGIISFDDRDKLLPDDVDLFGEGVFVCTAMSCVGTTKCTFSSRLVTFSNRFTNSSRWSSLSVFSPVIYVVKKFVNVCTWIVTIEKKIIRSLAFKNYDNRKLINKRRI